MSFIPTQEDIEYIKNNYMTHTSKEIARVLGCSDSYVKKIGKTVSNKMKPSNTYHCNESYFSVIDTYEKAYWLGFIMADGCIYQRQNKNSQKWVKITLNKSDVIHLEKFKSAINSNHPIKETIKKNGLEYSNITIVSNIMANDLSTYGCVERKTGNVLFPKFKNDDLNWGFIHGYIDGDGGISIAKDKNVYRYKLNIVGNFELINGIHNFLEKFNVVGVIREDKRKYSFPFYEVYFERMEYLNFIFNNTYNREIIYLDRKYERVKKYYNEKYNSNKEYYNQITPSFIEI